MHYRISILALFFLFACSDVEELTFDNELDPQNPTFTEPQTTLRPISQDNFLKNNFVVEWDGNISSMEFSHRLDQQPWSEWDIQSYTTLNYLDEGSHTFSVKGRYLSGYEEAVADSVSFIINAVTGPALRIAPLYKEATYGDLFSIDIMAEDLVNVAGVEVLLLFDASVLTYQRVEAGEFFTRAQGQVLEISKLKGANLVQIDIGAYDGDYPSASGSGIVATVFFNSLKAGQSSLTMQQNSSLRDKDNNVLSMNSLVNGIVVVK